uniref:J domain-containing protein n=1 Tax=Angiostrongylus cantonensis TaxID=6313 RepID=A0A0K0CTU2_ANGCA
MLLTDCKHHFNTDNLYDILCVERTATASELKKGYYKQSMKWHPDKAAVDEDSRRVATAKFQILTKIYEILSDKERRAVYDESGTIDEENLCSVDSINVWRRLFKKVTLEDVEKFCAQYKGSEEEEKDIIAAYNSWKGNHRTEYIQWSIKKDSKIQSFHVRGGKKNIALKSLLFSIINLKAASAKRRKKGMKEAKEAEAALAEIRAKEAGGSLEQVIHRRQLARSSDMDAYLDSLASKYCTKKKRAKK